MKILIMKFRTNDLNESLGSQIEFSAKIVRDFFEFTENNENIVFVYKDLNYKPEYDNQEIRGFLSLSPARGDYKVYQNPDGSLFLKDFFIHNLGLSLGHNKDDFFALRKITNNKYTISYISRESSLGEIIISQHLSGEVLEIGSEGPSYRTDRAEKPSHGRQIIYFGAPGTGKSHTIKRETSGKSVIRTTFHPDSDYSTFVGSYKPTMEEREVRVVPVVTANGINLNENQGTYKENRIVYKFTKQAFLKAYLNAWKKYSQDPNSPEEQYLVIEEINRGNCAQIFGDIFQLLDRSDNGFSSYPIEADNDIQQEIAKAFGSDEEFKIESDLQVDFAVEDYTSNYGETLSKDIQEGRIMLLPPNLYIWATMNTSDQSLFPIDSAFKRRWEWIYIPINTREKEWFIHVNGTNYVWGSFLEEINKKIGFITSSEDKKLGFYFCKATNNIISADRFVGKVLFYIYNDVFKDYGFDDEMFKKTNEKQLSFQDFYRDDGTINEEFAQKFLDNLHVITQRNGGEVEEDDDDDDEAGAGEGENGRDRSRYTINGEGNYPKKELSTAAIQKYIELNPQKTAADVINDWQSLGNIVPHFIESHEQYEQRTDRRGRDNTIDCRGEIIHVEHNGWQPNTIQRLIDAVNGKNWGIVLAKRE